MNASVIINLNASLSSNVSRCMNITVCMSLQMSPHAPARVCVCVCVLTQCVNSRHTRGLPFVLASDLDLSSLKTDELTIKL